VVGKPSICLYDPDFNWVYLFAQGRWYNKGTGPAFFQKLEVLDGGRQYRIRDVLFAHLLQRGSFTRMDHCSYLAVDHYCHPCGAYGFWAVFSQKGVAFFHDCAYRSFADQPWPCTNLILQRTGIRGASSPDCRILLSHREPAGMGSN